MAFTIDEIKEYAANPGSIPSPGSYGEGQLANIYEMAKTLKQAVATGKLSITEYQGLSEPLLKHAVDFRNSQNLSGSRGDAIAGAFNPLFNEGYLAHNQGQFTPAIPFSSTEYAKLPESVLPTQSDVQQGLFNPNLAPLQRFRTDPNQPQVNPGPGGQTGTAPVFTADPNVPPPYGGLRQDNSAPAQDAYKIANEAALQQQLSVKAQQERAATRQKYLGDLSNILLEQQNASMNEAAPSIYEDLNSRGLLHSSDLGNQMSTKLKELQGVTTREMARYGIDANTQDLTDLKGIQDNYNLARDSALNRQFSMEDYERQVRTGQMMGEAYANLKPAAPNKGKAALSGAAGGSAAGAPLGPWGAAGGAVAGGLVGGSK